MEVGCAELTFLKAKGGAAGGVDGGRNLCFRKIISNFWAKAVKGLVRKNTGASAENFPKEPSIYDVRKTLDLSPPAFSAFGPENRVLNSGNPYLLRGQSTHNT